LWLKSIGFITRNPKLKFKYQKKEKEKKERKKERKITENAVLCIDT